MKKFLAAMATAAILTVSAGTASAASFPDIPNGHWAYNAITQMSDAGIVEGYGDGTFRGDRSITNTEMARMAANLLVKVSPQSAAYAKKLVEDSSNDKVATRYEIALILANVCEKARNGNIPATPSAFSDVPNNHWAAKSVNLLAALKVMEGYGDGTFRGDRNMTRYEAGIMLAKLYKALSR